MSFAVNDGKRDNKHRIIDIDPRNRDARKRALKQKTHPSWMDL